MAESANKPQAPVPAPAPDQAPEPAPVAKKAPKRENRFLKVMGQLLTTTGWTAFGVGFIFLGILFHIKDLVPAVLKQPQMQLVPRLPYFLVGLGFFCVGHVRRILLAAYTAEAKKNKQFSHAWKIPLIIAEIAIYWLIFIYGSLVGIGKVQPITDLMAILAIFFFFLLYLLWYAVAYMTNRFPSLAAFRVAAFLGLVPALVSALLWTSQLLFLSLVFAALSLLAILVSIVLSLSKKVEQRLDLLRGLCTFAALILLAFVGWNALTLDKPFANLAQLALASKNPNGEVGSIAYSPESHEQFNNPDTATYQQLAFSLRTKEGCFLEIIDAKADKLVRGNVKDFPKEILTRFKIPAGEDLFRPVYIENGKSIMVDAVKGGERGLWKVNASTGAVLVLRRGGVQAIADGSPWSETLKQFLYVTGGGEEKYQLNAYPGLRGKKVLYTSNAPILSPSWSMDGKTIAFADGQQGTFNVLDPATGKASPFLSAQESAERAKWDDVKVTEVLPAPDGFRYLYLSGSGKDSTLWSVLADGTKRQVLYNAPTVLKDICWNPDAQRVLFEEKGRRTALLFYPFGFLNESRRIRILDANLGTIEDLIFPQINHRTPAVSPDGVKVAFVADQGLWLRQFSLGIWVAALR